MKIIRTVACFSFLIIVSFNANSQANGVCDVGETVNHPDCDGVCDIFDAIGSADCNGICDSGDNPIGPDCNGVCDALETSSSPDCNGSCDPGDSPNSPDCRFICNPISINLSSNLLCNNVMSGNTTGAPIATGDFCGAGSAQAVFYRFDALSSDPHIIKLSNNATDHVVAVYENCSATQTLVCAATEVSITLMQGESYVIAVFPTVIGSTSSFDMCIFIPEDYSTGNVGVKTTNPRTRLDVNGGIRPGFTSNEVEGNIRWSDDLEVFDGGAWTSLTQWNHDAKQDIDMNSNRIINLGTPVNGTDAATKDYVDASMDDDADPSNELQTITKSGNTVTLSLSGGTFTDAVDDADNDPTNEIETWSTLSGIPADIADGDDVNDADSDPSNELQTISKVGNVITLSVNGGSVSTNDGDSDPGNEVITSTGLTGNILELTEAGSTYQVDLSDIATQWQDSGSEIYFAGANVGVGSSNPDELLDVRGTTQVRMNSSGSSPQLQLVENSGTDGARINFQSSVETDNLWTLFGRADDTLVDNTFNIFHTTAGNIVRIQADGEIGFHGIPNTDLHVYHTDKVDEDGFKLQNNGTGGNWWRFFTSSSDGDLMLFSKAQGTTAIGAFDENTGVYSSLSDARYKEGMTPPAFDWRLFMSLQPYSYYFKNNTSKKRSIGLLAQDVKDSYPELVTYLEDKDQYLLDYSGLSVITLQAIQEQQKTIQAQDAVLKRLEVDNDALRRELDEIKAMLNKLVKD